MMCVLFTDEVKVKIEEYSRKLMSKNFTHGVKPGVKTSSVWNVFHQIFDDEGNIIHQFYFCTKCNDVVYSSRPNGSTTQLLRHPCVVPERANVIINSKNFEKIKMPQQSLFVLI